MNAILKAYWETVMLALLIWREARNQPFAAMVAVGCSVRNRVRTGGWWGKTYIEVILRPEQYSSFNPGSPDAKFPEDTDAIFPMCLAIARDVIAGTAADNTEGAQSYYDRSLDANPPKWATEMEHTENIGDFRFFKLRAAVGR